jgi:hypothetical protein
MKERADRNGRTHVVLAGCLPVGRSLGRNPFFAAVPHWNSLLAGLYVDPFRVMQSERDARVPARRWQSALDRHPAKGRIERMQK